MTVGVREVSVKKTVLHVDGDVSETVIGIVHAEEKELRRMKS